MGMPAMAAMAGGQLAGSLISGFSQSASYKGQAKVAQANAQAAASAADASIGQGYLNAQRDYQQGARQLGDQRAQMAANGIDIASGSALDTQSATGHNTGMTVGSDLYDANVKALNQRNQVASYNNEARADKSAARNAITGSIIQGSLSAASTFSSKWDDMFSSGSGGASASFTDPFDKPGKSIFGAALNNPSPWKAA